MMSKKLRLVQLKDLEEPDELEEQEETEEETNDDFENLYKGQVQKWNFILPSKRTRRIPEIKKPSLTKPLN